MAAFASHRWSICGSVEICVLTFMVFRVLAFLLVFTGSVTDAFKESDFKKCRDSAFCERNRLTKDGRQYRILPESVQFSESEVTARLQNAAVEKEFQLTLSHTQSGAIRLQLTEDAPVERYRVPDILTTAADSPTLAKRKGPPNSAQLQLSFPDDVQITLHYDPFRITMQKRGRELIQINANGLFHMEHTRQRTDDAEVGEWEEQFKNFKDSKPHGPQAISLDVSYHQFWHVYGIPEHSTDISLPVTVENGEPVSEPYRLYNLDVFEYDLHSPFGLYGSIPFLLGQNLDGAVGAFWLNSAEMYIDIWRDETATHSQWIAESGVLDVFLMMGASSRDVLNQYTMLTGTTAMPQYFALGYHQCRWNYRDEADVKQVDASMDHYGIPYDVLWLDIEHTDQKKYMTWDSVAFPDPVAMQEDLASRGRKMVTIVDPHIKNDEHYSIYTEAKKLGYYVKNTDGSDFVGHCWPGSSSYLDVTRPEVRDWWAEKFLMGAYEGMTRHLYIWNDMNEPSVFNGPEITMQKDLRHSGTVEHRDVHNLYGYLYHLATFEGLALRGKHLYGSDGDRPFVLSRAYFAGSQRLGPIWTGDNLANWDHLEASIPMLLTNGLAGMAFCGADVAGFFGNPDAELFTRWYQVAIFYPFLRAHAHIDTKRREPWVYGEKTMAHVRRALRERYALLPYIYTLFRESHLTGTPIMRPLWYEFLEDQLFGMQKQFMLGSAVMVCPVLEAGQEELDVYFPPGVPWYNAWTGEQILTTSQDAIRPIKVHLESIPFYYRGGSIIPRQERLRRSTTAMKGDPITLIVALDSNREAEGEIYLDDGHSYAYTRGQYLHRRFRFAQDRLSSHDLHPSNRAVTYRSNLMIEKIVVLGMDEDLQIWSDQNRLDASRGPLRLDTGIDVTAVVVKKPGLTLDSDWTLLFTRPKQ